jgi:L-lactate dehydrogenase complex protein LldF
MGDLYRKFKKDSETIAFNKEHRKTINFNISKYNISVEKGKHQYSNIELARKRAANVRHKSINNLDKYLVEFELKFQGNGGKVIWARDKDEALKEIMAVVKRENIDFLVKSKSIISEELELNEHLAENGISPIETDLGEYIVQLAGEKPYHIITPAMHKSKEDVARIFNEHLGTPEEATPEELTLFVREKLRKKFISSKIGITGANFILADTGSICLTENEGNAFMSAAFPKIHIVIAGIEKIIPSMDDLDLFWPLLSTYGTGQEITVYNHIVSGPKKAGESNGPEQMYVVLLDNGRSNLMQQERQRRALSCIKCGACLNVCPVYRNIGGYTYNTSYTGPIGSVITPYLNKLEDYKHLSFASSLCGMCTEVCPVKIPLHELLMVNRNDAVKQGMTTRSERFSMKRIKKVMLRRKMMNFGNRRIKNTAMKLLFESAWGPRRDLPDFNAKTFNQRWKELSKKR